MRSLLLLVSLLLSGIIQAEQTTISLAGPWKYQAGDDINWADPDLDDSAWEIHRVPESWYDINKSEYAWYRLTIDVSQQNPEDLGLQIGVIRNAHEVYVNGKLMGAVGKLPPQPEINYDKSQVYRLPTYLVGDARQVTVALRVWGGSELSMETTGAGPYGGSFLLGSYTQLMRELDARQIPMLIFASLFILTGIYFLYLHWKTQAVPAFLWFGTTSLLLAIYIVTQSQWKYEWGLSFLNMEKIEAISFFVFLSAIAQLIWSVIEEPVPKIIRFVQGFYVVLSVVYLFMPSLDVHYMLRPVWQTVVVLCVIPICWFVARQAYSGNQDARLLLYGFIVYTLFAVHDLVINLNLLTDTGTRLLPFGFLAILIAMSASLAGKFNAMLTSLEDQVLIRTQELSRVNLKLEQANHSLEEMTRIDPLTSLLNRRGLTAEAEIERQRFIRHREPMALVMTDIDHFKQFNDKYGHACGDKVLAEIATVFREHIRDVDRVARWGGEEFVLLFPGTDRDGLENITEKLRQRIEHFEIEYEGRLLSVTMTFGGAIYQASETIDECLARADAALYQGKKSGRNQVVITG